MRRRRSRERGRTRQVRRSRSRKRGRARNARFVEVPGTDSKPKKSRGKHEVHYEVIVGLLKFEAKEGLKGHVGE